MTVTDRTDATDADLRAHLDRLDTALAAATPGPWTATDPRADGGAYIDAKPQLPGPRWIGHATLAADAAAIVAAVNALPELIAELRKHMAAVRAAADLADELDRENSGPFRQNTGYRGSVSTRLRTALATVLTEGDAP